MERSEIRGGRAIRDGDPGFRYASSGLHAPNPSLALREKPAMHAPLSTEDTWLTPDNDPAPAPFGAFAPNAAQTAIIRLAQGSKLKRGAFRPMLSRLVNLMRAGPVDVQYQRASFRFYHQASATERGALFNPDYRAPRTMTVSCA